MPKEKDENFLRKQELNDIKTVLGTISGRRFVWKILERCKTHNTVFHQDSERITSFNAGMQNVGLFLMAEITEADQNLLFKMMKDNNTGDDDE